MPGSRARKARLEHVVAGQCYEARRQLALRHRHAPHGGRQIVVDDAVGHGVEVFERAHVAVEKRDLVGSVVDPREVATGVHQPHHEHPGLAALVADIDRDLEEVDLGRIAGAVEQRHVDLGGLTTLLAQPVLHDRQPDLVSLGDQLLVQPRGSDPLLCCGPVAPFLDDRRQPRLGLSATGRRRGRLALRTGSGSIRYFRTVLRLSFISRATRRIGCPSTRILCLVTSTWLTSSTSFLPGS